MDDHKQNIPMLSVEELLKTIDIDEDAAPFYLTKPQLDELKKKAKKQKR